MIEGLLKKDSTLYKVARIREAGVGASGQVHLLPKRNFHVENISYQNQNSMIKIVVVMNQLMSKQINTNGSLST